MKTKYNLQLRILTATLTGALALGTGSGCDQEGPMERSGERLDEAVEHLQDEAERATDKLEDEFDQRS